MIGKGIGDAMTAMVWFLAVGMLVLGTGLGFGLYVVFNWLLS